MRKVIFSVLALVLVIGGVWYLDQNDDQETESENMNTSEETDVPRTSAPLLAGNNAVAVFAQPASSEITVTTVVMENSGFVVIHESDNGQPGDIIGVSSYLEAGVSENFQIDLDQEVVDGQELFAMLHVDDGDTEFDPSADAPVVENDQVVQGRFDIDNEASVPEDIAI